MVRCYTLDHLLFWIATFFSLSPPFDDAMIYLMSPFIRFIPIFKLFSCKITLSVKRIGTIFKWALSYRVSEVSLK
jgi:hypothetical protein